MRRRLAALLTALLLATAACSDDGGGGSSEEADGSGGDGPAVVVDEDAGAMTQGLSLVPENDDDGTIVIVNDYAGAGEALDLDRPEAGADEDEIADWFIPMTTGRDDVVGGLATDRLIGGGSVLEDEAWRDEVGWAPIDVDIAVDLQTEDYAGYVGYLGDFDPEAIDEAVNDEENPWADEIEVEEQNGVEYFTWGDDPADSDADRVTTVRPLGQGSNMAVLDGALLWSVETDALEDGIDAATGEDDSMVDDDELSALAEAMDGVDAVGALFSADGHAFDDALIGGVIEDSLTDGEVPDDLEDVPALEPYEAFATGVRIDDDGPQIVIALLHDDEDAAEANADNLETVIEEGESAVSNLAWSEQFRLDDADVDGSMLVATLDLDDPRRARFWVDFVYQRDSLLYAA